MDDNDDIGNDNNCGPVMDSSDQMHHQDDWLGLGSHAGIMLRQTDCV